MGVEHIDKEMMITIPGAFGIQWDDKDDRGTGGGHPWAAGAGYRVW
jgi:hypothetical protein